MPQSVTRARIEKVTKAGLDGITFEWIGGLERGDPHYYRVQGPTFLTSATARRTVPTTFTPPGATSRVSSVST